jgi:subtilisin family serine protease
MDNIIEGYYLKYLGREADAGGLEYYRNMVFNGMSLFDVENLISTSEEAQNYVPDTTDQLGTPVIRYITRHEAFIKPWVIDTGAYLAWQSGWTGQGVTIGVLDWFEGGTHGDNTSRIAQDVAVDATVRDYPVFDSTGAFIPNSFGAELLKAGKDGCKVINMSVGAYGAAVAQENSAIRYILQTYDMLFVLSSGNDLDFAAGKNNGGNGLTPKETNYYALSSVADEATRNHTIVVGSIDNNNRGEYGSGKAGITKDFYVCAEDDLKHFGNTGKFEGTSFAAPRVAGLAAILRHKYPNATAPDIQKLILDTCRDIGEPMVYGRGKVDILSAIHKQL